jgi:SAM-dependent methyltransferase
VLESARERILGELDDDAVVLDIGGWADPVPRADWVIDLMPHETRGLYEREGWVARRADPPERFTAESWIVRDLCDREPYPFEDGSIDFVICAHTLEDLRDPLFVCSEINRIGKAGYVEVPSRLEEQAWGVAGEYVGWPHHRWLIDLEEDRLTFAQKLHSIHARPDQQFPRSFWEGLTGEQRVEALWWRGGFSYREVNFVDGEASDRHLREPVDRVMGSRTRARSPLERLRRRARR